MTPTIQLNERDRLNFEEKLALLAMPPKKRFWILKTLGRWERANARRRISQQRDVKGRALKPRQNRKKGKILRRMGKGLEPYVKNANRLELTWKNKLTGRIAARHHAGQTQKVTAAQMRKRWGKPNYKASCTKGQARKLRELGYTVPRKSGKGRKKPSLRYIMQSVSHGQAGLLIREMTNQPSKQSWSIPLAERQILGSREKDVNRQLIKIMEQARRRN
ncbi:virion morphogenesis protein [Photobacterium rosenbergii]|uniref:Virion morphogenesis protein n=1 Tax=Photobacterium rosenbergii TaxID=294936 RepID=A0A2T3NHG0_9GAMM|nr:virion morphogenesis protein [Photobacterium rosenbergii]PSW14413.1 virion morphogenesis protein [Photobacterium rosenbergii]